MPCVQNDRNREFLENYTPIPRVDRATLDQLIAAEPAGAVCDALFTGVNENLDLDAADIPEGDIIVYTVSTFLFETLNGGIMQYFTNPSGHLAHRCAESLRRIGAYEYASIIEDCIAEFTSAESPADPRWEADLDAYWDANEDEPFEAIEERFRTLYRKDEHELTNLLYSFVCQHRELFAPYEFEA